MNRVDHLIIGQGLAGTCLAICLQRAGKKVLVVDRDHPSSSSRVAAGFLHPVTGRRIVKTWMADQLFPFAAGFYQSVADAAGRPFFHPMDSMEMITETKQLNDWSERSADPSLHHYLSEVSETERPRHLQQHLKLFRVRQGGWLDIPGFLDHHKSKWKGNGVLHELTEGTSKQSDHQTLTAQLSVEATNIVYCEGHAAVTNPLWAWLPFDPAKGELLTVEIPELDQEHILVNGIFLIPLGGTRFRVGATYSWHSLDDHPTEAARNQLIEKLGKTIRLPFEILDHKAGVRPAVKGRRPLVGQHPVDKKCYIMNGLGSKGGTLAPWFADHLTKHLVHGNPLLPEADIARFIR